jgi:hypothetical protein
MLWLIWLARCPTWQWAEHPLTPTERNHAQTLVVDSTINRYQLRYQTTNKKGLHRCKPFVFWLPDLDSNQGPAD